MKNSKLTVIKRVFCVITVLLFLLVLVVPGVLFFVLPKKDTSEIERRKLEKMPELTIKSLLSGAFTDDYSKYYSDNFIFRDFLVKTSFDVKDLRGIRADDVKIYSSDSAQNISGNVKNSIDEALLQMKLSLPDLGTPMLGEEQIKKLPASVFLQNESEYADLTKADLEGEKRGALFMIGDTALEIFYGNKNICTDYANTINSFRYSLPSEVNVYNSVVPTHFEFGLPSKYKDSVGTRQKQFIENIYELLDANVKSVDAYSEIQKHYNDGEYLYFRTDHHWTALGAYYAYVAFAKQAGFEPVPLSDYEIGKIDKFLGTFYSSTYDKNLSDNPDFVEYYVPFTEHTMTNYDVNGAPYEGKVIYSNVSGTSAGYLVFTGGDHPLCTIKTSNNTGKSIIVFKESYGNAFVPFLLPHYDTVYVADIRSFPFSSLSFIEDKEITDVLFLNNIMSACTPARVLNIINLLNKE